MYQIDSANTETPASTPAAIGTEGYFRDGVSGVHAGTTLDADWMNALQGSLIAVLDDRSLAHSKTDSTLLLRAIKLIVDSKVDDAVPVQTGYHAGLLTTTGLAGSHFVSVEPGLARDVGDTTTARITSTALGDLSIAGPWTDAGNSVLASSNTYADPYYGRLWLMGKVGTSEGRLGVDQDDTAANLRTDAANAGTGWTTFRQIGWVIRDGGTGLLKIRQSHADPTVWRFDNEGITDHTEASVPATTEQEYDVTVPEKCLHIGSHHMKTSAAAVAHIYAQIGIATTTTPTISAHNHRHITDPNEVERSAIEILGVAVSGGAATLQGKIRCRFSSTSGSLNYAIHTSGFVWTRDLQT